MTCKKLLLSCRLRSSKGPHRVYIARKGDNPVGAVMEATAPDGYSGAIQLLVGSDFSGTVLGTRVTEHHETPGLGDKIETRLSDWILHFAGKMIHGEDDPAFAVKKDGGEFDQFTGATITPRAVVNAVKRAGLYAETLPAQINHLSTCEVTMSGLKRLSSSLWKNNSALVQLLGLCPLLAVTSTATNALGLGLATTLVLTLTNFSISVLRRWTPSEIRIPIYVMIIASVVSVVQMLINAYAFGLYQSLGIFIPLIVTNCIVVGRAEAFAVKNNPAISALDGFSIGMGATAAMFVLGSLREILGNGTLFDGADALLGGWAKSLRIEVFHTDTPFLLAMLPRRLHWPWDDAGVKIPD